MAEAWNWPLNPPSAKLKVELYSHSPICPIGAHMDHFIFLYFIPYLLYFALCWTRWYLSKQFNISSLGTISTSTQLTFSFGSSVGVSLASKWAFSPSRKLSMLDNGTVKTGAWPLLSVDLSSRVRNNESSKVWIFSRPPSMPCIGGGWGEKKTKILLCKLHITCKWPQVCVYIYLCSQDHCASTVFWQVAICFIILASRGSAASALLTECYPKDTLHFIFSLYKHSINKITC